MDTSCCDLPWICVPFVPLHFMNVYWLTHVSALKRASANVPLIGAMTGAAIVIIPNEGVSNSASEEPCKIPVAVEKQRWHLICSKIECSSSTKELIIYLSPETSSAG